MPVWPCDDRVDAIRADEVYAVLAGLPGDAFAPRLSIGFDRVAGIGNPTSGRDHDPRAKIAQLARKIRVCQEDIRADVHSHLAERRLDNIQVLHATRFVVNVSGVLRLVPFQDVDLAMPGQDLSARAGEESRVVNVIAVAFREGSHKVYP